MVITKTVRMAAKSTPFSALGSCSTQMKTSLWAVFAEPVPDFTFVECFFLLIKVNFQRLLLPSFQILLDLFHEQVEFVVLIHFLFIGFYLD